MSVYGQICSMTLSECELLSLMADFNGRSPKSHDASRVRSGRSRDGAYYGKEYNISCSRGRKEFDSVQ